MTVVMLCGKYFIHLKVCWLLLLVRWFVGGFMLCWEKAKLCFMMKSSESIPEVGAKCSVTQFTLDIHLLMSEEDICEFWRY